MALSSTLDTGSKLDAGLRRDRDDAPVRNAPLRICYITETLHAGVGRHLVGIISQLAARGHEIHLIYSPVRMDESFRAAIERQPGVRCVGIPMRRSIGLGDVGAFRRVKEYVAANGPFDIIHGHSSKGGGYARLLKLFAKTPVIYTPNAFVTVSPTLPRSMRFIYTAIEVLLSSLTDRVICVSQSEHEHARELGIAQPRLTVIPNGADALPLPPREIVRAELGAGPDDVIVGFLGRMDDQKAPHALVAAMRHVMPEFPRIKLVMVGDGPKRQMIDAAISGLGVGDRARCFNFSEGNRYMSGFDMLVVPSLYEGFAYVLIEALNAGLPIVSTPVGGTDEAIALNENGFIVPHGSDTRMAEAIRRLASDDRLRRAMGAASKERAAYFTVSRMVDATEQLYFEISAARPAARRTPRAVTVGADASATQSAPLEVGP